MSCFDCNDLARNFNILLPTVMTYTVVLVFLAKMFIRNRTHRIMVCIGIFLLVFFNLIFLGGMADPHLVLDTNLYSDHM